MSDQLDREALGLERDFLLTSLDDLDAEFAAGDIDEHDYQQLKDSYTARAAAVIRLLDQPDGPIAPTTSTLARGADAGGSHWLRWTIGLGVLGVLAGWALALATGERGTGGLTGSVEQSLRDRTLECQQMGTDLTKLIDSLQCFDSVLDEDPNNVEALTYRGWYVILVSRTAADAGDDESSAQLLESGLESLNRAIEISPAAPDARAFRTVAREQLGDIEGACEDVAVLAAGEPSPMITGLVGPVADRIGCPLG